MNSDLRLPRERVAALEPADLKAYLLAHGWHVDRRTSSQDVGVYHRRGDRRAEILVPRDKGFLDYALRVGDVLQELAMVEGRTAWEVLDELSTGRPGSSPNGPAGERRGTGDGASAAKRDAS
jgi:hypothetical protein